MLEHFWSWLARIRGHPGHIAFGEARSLYLRYVETLVSPFDRLSAADFEGARNNPDLLRAEALYRAAREHSANEGRNDNVAMSDYQLGLLLHLQGRFTEAQKHLELAVEWLRASVTASAPRRSALSGSFYHLGLLAMRRGDRGEAERLLLASLAIDEEDADSYGISLCRSAMETLATWPFDGVLPDDRPSAEVPVASLGDLSPQVPSFGDAPEGAPQLPARGRASGEGDPENGREMEEIDSLTITSTAVVWLLSHSVEANDIYMAQLEMLLARGAVTRLLVRRTAVGSADPAQSALPRLEPDEYLYAAILVLEEEGLNHDAYLYLAKQCLSRVTELEHFRLFVGGVQAGRLVCDYKRTAGAKGKEFLEGLKHEVQLGNPKNEAEKPSGSASVQSQVPGPDEVCSACWAYLRQARAVRAAAFWRRVRMVVARSAGRFAYCSQAAAATLVGLAALAGLALGSGGALSHFVASHAGAVACLAGIVWFPVNTLPAYYLLRGMRAVARMPQERPDLARLFVAFLPASLGIGVLIDRLRPPLPWFVLGIAAGCLIDHVRRAGVQQRRAGVSLRRCRKRVEEGRSSIAEEVLSRGAKLVEHPMFVPLFPSIRPRVFVSYTHRSVWSSHEAHRLDRLLRDQGTVSFIDQQSIGPGSSWWSVLNRSLGETDVFVAFLDAKATTQPMVAAELLAALEARAASGTPRILVLAGPDLAGRNRRESFPVFEAVLADPVSPESHRQVRIIPGAGPVLDAVASDLKPARYETTAVVPGAWAKLLQVLTLPLVILAPPIVEIAGWFLGVLALLEHWERTNVGAFLESSQLLGAACLVGAYLAGFAARLLAARAFEVGGLRRGLGPFGVLALPFVGISALVFVWSKGLSPLLLGWVAVLAGAGWYLAEVFLGTVRREKPNVFGPE